ncbi:hypothetical protein CBP34_18215 [Acidovorax carolinensis]|uniref:Uncharacterized protein n=2 Tax=Acidovorax carolinensis TaxID=553814 RepID=A0A240UHE8_9BURK|nr:IclR family transcriptional regulator C-terminal domain-containing protein [Acidovorax carolinensis]ART53212.1 hypothetical protein CBP34_18215 [Acidovorax carolinensis]ART53956.1 hypothetical protein CBP35_01035 [Acidovorax carolinensis]ART60440.1 hypothetical protein CBP36_17875 [Acidovorax carolinensis]
MDPTSSSSYRHCQSLVKGLDLLAALNRHSGAAASIMELSRSTGQHRTTVKRLLETLRDAGYVEWEPHTNLYRLTFRVQRLSYGFRDNVSVTEIAWPHMRALSKTIVWPCSLVSLEGDEMVVRVSTRSYSPLSFHPGMPGRRLPLLTTAAGRTYLAFAPATEQTALIDLLRERPDHSGQLARDRHFVRTMIEKTRERGYGVNQGEWAEEPKFGAVAVPLHRRGRLLGCLNVIFLSRGVTEATALQKIVRELHHTANRIEEVLDSDSPRGGTEPAAGTLSLSP